MRRLFEAAGKGIKVRGVKSGDLVEKALPVLLAAGAAAFQVIAPSGSHEGN